MNAKKSVWWVQPDKLILFFIIPILLMVFWFSDPVLQTRMVSNYLGIYELFISLIILLFFALSSHVSRSVNHAHLNIDQIPCKYLDYLFFIVLIAYFLWFGGLLTDPSLLIDAMMLQKGAVYKIRTEFTTIPGVTTLTQAGMVYVIFFHEISKEKLQKRHWYFLYMIYILTLFRAFVWSERLALIEVVVISAVFFGAKYYNKAIIKFMPLIGIFLLFFYFSITEFFRSWNFYQSHYDSLFDFVFHRISEYYVFALNTGFGILETHSSTASNAPYYSLEWLYQFPIIGAPIYDFFNPSDPTKEFLNLYGDPELNNVSGLATIVFDFGLLGSALYISVLGYLFGAAYQGYINKIGILRFYYPILFVSLVELLRIPYLTLSRSVAAVIVLSIFILPLISKKREG